MIQNVNAKVAKNANDIKQALISQLSNPVQWTATMQSLADKKYSFWWNVVMAMCYPILPNANKCRLPLLQLTDLTKLTNYWRD